MVAGLSQLTQSFGQNGFTGNGGGGGGGGGGAVNCGSGMAGTNAGYNSGYSHAPPAHHWMQEKEIPPIEHNSKGEKLDKLMYKDNTQPAVM